MNHLSHLAIVRRWLIGMLGSWLVVWLVGVWVLDSILVRTYDPALGVNTLRPGDVIHWRSEGWGRTVVGEHGLPGWQPAGPTGPGPTGPPAIRLILWGDSQVEGVCVDDPDKLHSQTIRIASHRCQRSIDCLPLGRSGADARDWQDLMSAADRLWNPDLHVWVITDLSDLTVAVAEDAMTTYRRWTVESPAWVKWGQWAHANALFAASKRILRDPNTGSLRRLDFSLGPRRPASSAATHDDSATSHNADTIAPPDPNHQRLAAQVAMRMASLAEHYNGRIALVYAPATPRLLNGLEVVHPDDAAFSAIEAALAANEITVVDCRQAFVDLWQSAGKLPRGFHNGMPSYGHLNADGNRIVAEQIITMVQERFQW